MSDDSDRQRLIALKNRRPGRLTAQETVEQFTKAISNVVRQAEAEMQRRCAEAALSFIKKGGDPEQIAQAIKGLK